MKDLLKKIWQKIKEYKVYVILFLVSVLFAVIDLSIKFDIHKCFTYVALLFILLYNIVVYIKLIDTVKKNIR